MTEKRQTNRINSINLSYVLIDDEGSPIHQGMGRTMDLSTKGILLETSFPIDAKNSVLVTIGLADEIIEVRGKVSHQERLEDGNFSSGICFMAVSDQVITKIDTFLNG
jgi:hypothetical protein